MYTFPAYGLLSKRGKIHRTGGLGVPTQTLGEPLPARLAPLPWDVSPVGQRGRS